MKPASFDIAAIWAGSLGGVPSGGSKGGSGLLKNKISFFNFTEFLSNLKNRQGWCPLLRETMDPALVPKFDQENKALK